MLWCRFPDEGDVEDNLDSLTYNHMESGGSKRNVSPSSLELCPQADDGSSLTGSFSKLSVQDSDEIRRILTANNTDAAAVNSDSQKSHDTQHYRRSNSHDYDNAAKHDNAASFDSKERHVRDHVLDHDSNRSNILKSRHNLSRPNTPQSPRQLSRSSSVKQTSRARRQRRLDAQLRAMETLAPRADPPAGAGCSLQSCLNQFTAAELLTGNNKFGCEVCTKRKHANTTDKDGKFDGEVCTRRKHRRLSVEISFIMRIYTVVVPDLHCKSSNIW